MMHYRSVFISDVHLGTRECRAGELLQFLQSMHCETLYLVGDILDLWDMHQRVYWPATHTQIVQTILDKARQGTRVIYIPGNHDAAVRALVGKQIYGVEIAAHAVHTTADGRRFWVSHGDEFDTQLTVNPLLKAVADQFYQGLIRLNRLYNGWRQRRAKPYWSLSLYLKERLPSVRRYIQQFEQAAAAEAKARRCDGYIGGHIHKAGMSLMEHSLYCNIGDWVEHCSALVEDAQGHLQILCWHEQHRLHSSPRIAELQSADV
ncbi:UDP-2,3-diacylglucosamine diphosphatase [Thiorhodospira sibirica]|uniref:UDP-2,3-diacylglucosamine diphosphatase n=1 Tax=Thiorhodospira sibirica TaxID=154347 RepID=UPI00022C11BF|nr:UDP-2,3-diacylglucosamine diphosphatase [Thiorhodospira sibirica]